VVDVVGEAVHSAHGRLGCVCGGGGGGRSSNSERAPCHGEPW
jgi:hypothetical protein